MDKIRLGIFEFMACWFGGVTAEQVGRVLGLTRESVQRSVIGSYRGAFPHALRHEGRTRRTVFSEDAAALRLSPSDPDDVITLLRAATIVTEAQDVPPIFPVPVESVAVPQGLGGQEDRLKEITRAIAHGNALSVDYAAKTRRIAMTFSPHTIVRTPDRIHVRGHASEDSTEPGYFMDLVPARMLDASNLGHDHYVGDADDVDWHRHESLTVRLRSDLPEPLRDALLQEHGGDTIKIHRVRKALHRYYRIAFESRRVENVDGPLWIVED